MQNKKTTAGETAIQIFNSEQFGTIRTAGTVEQPMFCLTDVCKALALNPSDVKKRLDDGVVSIHSVTDSKGRKNRLNFVNEDGLYDVILDSRKPEAKAFRKWVTSEVLPSIRKTGGYIAAKADESPEQIMARALKVADETMKRQQAQLEASEAALAETQAQLNEANELIHCQDGVIDQQSLQLRHLIPFANYARNAIESNTMTYTMTDTSQFLGFARVSDFMDWCVRLGILRRLNGRWMPTPKYLDQGLFATRVFRKVVSASHYEEIPYTVVTEQGRMMLFGTMEQYTKPEFAIDEPFTFAKEGGAR